MKKVLFLRKFKKISGGQIKHRDYFVHCLSHPELEPYVYLTPDSSFDSSNIWLEAAKNRIVKEKNLQQYDVIFVEGVMWRYVSEICQGCTIINLIQHVKHGDKTDERFTYLTRPALRICVSQEVYNAVVPYAVGEAVVINNGVSFDMFLYDGQKHANSILIWAKKNRSLGKRLYEKLTRLGAEVSLLTEYLARDEFARRLGETDIFVALPHEREGFYLPALEAMVSNCAVVCSDAIGNRSFCIHEHTCLVPKFNNYESHVTMIQQLLTDISLREQIRRRGFEMAQSYSLQHERDQFYRFLQHYVLSEASTAEVARTSRRDPRLTNGPYHG